MDINAALNEIIFKYHLDRCYPHYRNMCEAEKILKNIIQGIVRDNRKTVFVGSDKTGIEFVHNISRDCDCIHFVLCDKNEKLSNQLEVVNWKEYDEIYLISFYGAEYYELWFSVNDIQYKWIYDIFEQGGAFFRQEFFRLGKEDLFAMICKDGVHSRNDIIESIQLELFCQHNKYESTKDSAVKKMALKKCLFLSLYMRNFLMAEEYFVLLSKESKEYEEAWQEICELLASIKKEVRQKEQEDIILYWLDAISYGDEKDMLFLQDIFQKSIVFENAYSYIANTHPVLREIFLGKKDIDNHTYNVKKISQENSPLIRMLEEQGYNIKIIGGYFHVEFPYQYVSEQFYMEWYTPPSMMLWDMLANMLRQKQRTFYVIHAMGTHFPYLSCKIRSNNYKDKNERYRLARQELDEQLAFFDEFINKDILRIYMSDHGHVNSGMNRHHTLFNIYSSQAKKENVEDFFSFTDFETVLRQIIVNGDIQEWKFIREYAEIGRLDRYSSRDIRDIFKNKSELHAGYIGYRGIIDKEYVYVRYNTGKEWLQRRDDMPLCEPLLFCNSSNDICDADLISRYRKMVADYPDNMMEEAKFKYTRYLWRLYDNILPHSDMEERVRIINMMLRDYPDNSIAIRMGGAAAASLYYVLSKENRRKIWGFIDNDKECLCSKLSMPVIGTNEIEDTQALGIKAVILSSYTYLEMLRNESKLWKNIDALDIYDCLEKNGIMCQSDFYRELGTDEDYDVGFPFEEVKL